MPNLDQDGQVFQYPMPSKGVNLYKNILDLEPEECLYAQNLVYRNGMVSRNGQNLMDTDEVVASKKILGVHKFYFTSGWTYQGQLLAACDTTVKYLNAGTWTNVKTGLTTGLRTYFTTWEAMDKCFISNGTDTAQVWTGAAVSDLTGTNAPTTALKFLPYQDRLIAITGGDLVWSASYNDAGTWLTVSDTGARLDTQLYGMVSHGLTNVDAGYETAVLIAGASGMYLFKGTDLRTPATTGNYTVYKLATKVGCNAPDTMVWTPKGNIWLGTDKQVYLLPFDSLIPIPIGTKIKSTGNISGIEDTPTSQLPNACAVYHNGYYKLAVAGSGQSVNNVQWWLDIDRGYVEGGGQAGPWYGPMVGTYDATNSQHTHSINCMTVQNGAGDSGELIGGEAYAKGYVYQLDVSGINTDYKQVDASVVSIAIQLQTSYNPLGDDSYETDCHKCELEVKGANQTYTVDFHDITGAIKTGDSFSIAGNNLWGSFNWGAQNWTESKPERYLINISPALKARRLSLVIKSSTISADSCEIYKTKVFGLEQREVFA